MLNSRVTFELLGVFVKQPSSDNTPYEKIGDEVRSLADEVPFNIPDSWEWVRLGTVIQLQSGQDMTPDRYNDCGKGIPYITGASNIENGSVLINRWTEYGRAFAYCGDILLTCKGTVGTMAVLQETQVHIARQIMAIRPISELYIPYIQIVLDTLVENLKAAAKSMIPGIAREDVLQSLFPVPPVSEQKRIVQKITDLSPCLSQYAAADTKLFSLNAFFPETLKKSILQEAVQGKLVPQDPSDEPAEALLGRIRAEKQRLIKEGKIKKDKHESVIFRRDNSHYEKRGSDDVCIDDEIPFEVPSSWALIRLDDIGIYRKGPFGSSLTKSMFVPKGADTVKVYEQKNAIQKEHTLGTYYITRQYYESKMRSFTVEPGDILVSCAGTIGETYVLPEQIELGIINQALMRMTIFAPIELDYFLLYFDYVLKQTAKESSKGSAIKNIPPFEIFKKLILPLPPLEEQKRIVAKVRELKSLCNSLCT